MKNKKKLGCYVHIPFCVKKCNYCDFLSFADMDGMHEEYYKALKREIAGYSEILYVNEVDTVFFGGGTPTVFPPDFICEIIKSLAPAPDAEITVEANPGTVNRQYLKSLKDCGVDRISFGLQSCEDALLKTLGRIHNFDMFRKNYYQARELGFERINLDLMFALPGQSAGDWARTLETALDMLPSSVSAYPLAIEEGTVFGDMLADGSLCETDEQLDREMYHYAKKMLAGRGYMHYEISNFAKSGFECAHNIKYWTRQDYLGLGLNAHSFLNGSRFRNTSDMHKYISDAGNSEAITRDKTWIGKDEAMSERMFLGLRLTRGVDKREFYKEFGIDAEDVFGRSIKKLAEQGLIYADDKKISLTDIGFDLANIVMAEFV